MRAACAALRILAAGSSRHACICLRLMEEADIYQIAKNCRTSVEMIEKNDAFHITTRLDASAIIIMRKKKVAKSIPKESRSVACALYLKLATRAWRNRQTHRT